MGHSSVDPAFHEIRPWNEGRLIGAKRALKQQQVWAIRFWLERRRWNLVMHSQYLIEPLEHGFPVIRSARTRRPEPGFDQEDMTRIRMDEILREAAELAFEVGIVNAQLIQACRYQTVTASKP